MNRTMFQWKYLIGIFIGLIILAVDLLYFFKTPYFIPLIVISFTIVTFQYWLDFFMYNRRQKEIESQFPDFVRNLVSAIKSGMPITQAIIHVSDRDYAALTPFVRKLAYKVEWSIPVHKALLSFSESTNNPVIKRSVSTVIEAEQYGGNIEDVLDAITTSLVHIQDIKEKRAAAIQTQVVQNYIIFFVFLGVMIVIQNMLIPYVGELHNVGLTQSKGAPMKISAEIVYTSFPAFMLSFFEWAFSLHGIFLFLSLIQGGFAGIVIGKLSEGRVRYGIKHTLSLMTVALFVMSLTQGFL